MEANDPQRPRAQGLIEVWTQHAGEAAAACLLSHSPSTRKDNTIKGGKRFMHSCPPPPPLLLWMLSQMPLTTDWR